MKKIAAVSAPAPQVVSGLTQEIHRIQLDLPNVDIFRFRNTVIQGDRIFVHQTKREIVSALPTMYKSWTESQRAHIGFEYLERHPIIPSFEPVNDLMIFDTWGTSSYYHLLIDHIIPLWITRTWFQEELGIFNGEIDYVRISRNSYEGELATAREIFNYFFGGPFIEHTTGIYRNIIYGYFFNYRPYHGPGAELLTYCNYKKWLYEFRRTFCRYPDEYLGGPILVPARKSRNFEYVDRFVQKYCDRIHFKSVDFAELSIGEQIRIAGMAEGLFGCEGAAFANQVFMRSNSLIIPVASEPERLLFHQTLSTYLEHRFFPVTIDALGHSSVSDSTLLQFLRNGD